jgi:hypothetical protein
MQTWIRVELLLNPTKEVLFAQELALSSNFDLLNAVELNPRNRAFNFVCRKMLNSLYHARSVEQAYFTKRKLKTVRMAFNVGFLASVNRTSTAFIKEGLTLRLPLNKKHNIQKPFLFHHSIRSSKRYYKTTNKGYISSTGVNLFSTGVYRYYKSHWYKLIMVNPIDELERYRNYFIFHLKLIQQI